MPKTAVSPPAPPAVDAAPPREQPGYTVVARRYRPKQFTELIGQEHVAAAMTNAIASGRIAHAYLFTGARGVGKTSAARILAKALNCKAGPTATPCDACPNCLGITAGDDVDVLEIDGASNNKVDEIRDLKNNVGFRPTRSRFKIYIIDEVHMLTTSAFNALLKTLEEPPPHVKFILATTEVQKIPITILSRCQRFDFATVGPAKIFEQLKFVVGKEGIAADDDALRIVARRAAGSMRDSQSLLDQLLAFAEGHLTAAKVHRLFGTAPDEIIGGLADAVFANDAAAALTRVAEASAAGAQLGELLDQLVEFWRGLMLFSVAGPDFPHLPAGVVKDDLARHAGRTNLDTVLAGIDVLTSAKEKAKRSGQVQVLLELAVVRLARLEEFVAISALAKVAATPGAAPSPRPAPKPAAAADAKKKSPAAPEPARDAGKSAAVSAGEIVAANLPQVWRGIVDTLGGITGQSLVLASLPALPAPNSLVIRFPAEYSSACEYCASERVLASIRAALQKINGKEWVVRVELDATPTAPSKASRPAEAPDRKKAMLQRPLFKLASEALGAQLVQYDDAFDPDATTPVPTLSATATDFVPDTAEEA